MTAEPMIGDRERLLAAQLSVYHQRRIRQARERLAELRALKTTEMGLDALLMWVTRLEVLSGDLLNVVDLQALAAGLKEVTR